MAGSGLVFRRRVRALLLVLPVLSSLVFLTVSPIPVDAAAGSRLTGSTRAQTAVAVAKHVAGGDLRKLTRIIVVSERSVVDATLATSLAGVLDRCAPTASCRTAVLLTGPTTLDADTQTAIRDSGLPASALLIVGGPGAINDTVRDSIARAAGWNGSGVNPITRLGGSTRYDTALAITSYVTATKKAQSGDTPSLSFDTLIVVNGDRPADLLLAASLAHGLGQLIVLTRPNDLPDASRWMFALTQPQRITIIGGTTNTTPTLETALRNLLPTSGALTRIGGTDRYETSTLVANLLATNGVTNIAIVSGLDLTDTTTMGLLAQPGAPILYVTPTNIPDTITTWLKANSRLGIIITTIGNTTNTPDTITQTINNTITTSTPKTGTPTPPAPDPDPTLPYFAIEVTTTSPNQSATLPLRGDIDVIINWGAPGLTCPTTKTGSGVTTSAGNVTCTYPTAGTYLIRLDPNTGPGPWLTGFGDWDGYPHAQVIRRVRGWGNLGLTNLDGAFYGATNLTWVATPPSGIGSLIQTFQGATSFNQNISNWDTSSVGSMRGTFTGASSFNNGCQPGIPSCPLNWNTAAVANMNDMFAGASSFNQSLNTWNMAMVEIIAGLFDGATRFNNGCVPNDFTCSVVWNVPPVSDLSGIFKEASAFNQNVNGVSTSASESMLNTFYGATAFNNGCPSGATTPACPLNWNTSNVTNMGLMFYNATAFNQNINSWNTASVSAMNFMFAGAHAFNQPISNWNTSNVTNMSNMFSNALAFNQPISNWNTSNVTNMSYMFFNATAFNQPIGNITTSAVTNMEGMFRGAVNFNQNIGSWNTSAVTNMGVMFYEAHAFNQPIGTWNTSAVTNMSSMFAAAHAFNQPIGTWNTSNVTGMGGMFYRANNFNQPIGTWNTSNVSNSAYMFFEATSFNQPIGTWNTSNVTDMSYMFTQATAFDQNIENWNVRNVTNMNHMFGWATAFNQNLALWCVNKILSEPGSFYYPTGPSALWTLAKPRWGPC
ncbi:MAG: BspA family leucine-rich repeat surface protein [Actinobacteria bacterium]|nr:BspA family leucine-rich repeat surface protein [Actinomycetota bacterium]